MAKNWEDKRKENLGYGYKVVYRASGVVPKTDKPPKPAQKTYSCYEEERMDRVALEMAAELKRDCPNWTYLDLLDKERKYWRARFKARHKSSYSGMFSWLSPFGSSDDIVDDE